MSQEDFREMTEEEKTSAMSLEDAQTEANILRHLTFQDTLGNADNPPVSKEEYDQALGSLEKLIDKAENERMPEKTQFLQTRLILIIQKAQLSLASLLHELAIKAQIMGPSKGTIDEKIKSINADLEYFKNCSQKLEDLKTRATVFENLPKD